MQKIESSSRISIPAAEAFELRLLRLQKVQAGRAKDLDLCAILVVSGRLNPVLIQERLRERP